MTRERGISSTQGTDILESFFLTILTFYFLQVTVKHQPRHDTRLGSLFASGQIETPVTS